MHGLGSIQVQYQTVLETSVFCRLKMAIIPAEVGVCSWNSTARRHPMDAAAAIFQTRSSKSLGTGAVAIRTEVRRAMPNISGGFRRGL